MGTGKKILVVGFGIVLLATGVAGVAVGDPFSGIAVGLFGLVCLSLPFVTARGGHETARTEVRDGEPVHVYPFRRKRLLVLMTCAFALAGLAMALGAGEMAAESSDSPGGYRAAGIVCFVLFGAVAVKSLPTLFRETYVALTPRGFVFRSAANMFIPWRAVAAAWEAVHYSNEVIAIELKPGSEFRAGRIARAGMALNRRLAGWDMSLGLAFHDPALADDFFDHLERHGEAVEPEALLSP